MRFMMLTALAVLVLSASLAAASDCACSHGPHFDAAQVKQSVDGEAGVRYHLMRGGNVYRQQGDSYRLIDKGTESAEISFTNGHLYLRKNSGHFWTWDPETGWRMIEARDGHRIFGDPPTARARERAAKFSELHEGARRPHRER